jgi:predicted RNA-binding Zn-ribbon protein involved in translation (DUF1610 family)
MSKELWDAWQCQQCGYEGCLSVHGECAKCGSQAVIPIAAIRQEENESERGLHDTR